MNPVSPTRKQLRRLRPATFLLLLLAAFMLASALLSSAGCATRVDTDDEAAQKPPPLPPDELRLTPAQQAAVHLETAAATISTLPEVVALPARVQVPTGRSAQARAPVAGYLAAPKGGFPPIGARVRPGQPLAMVQEAYSGTERVQMQVNIRSAQAAVMSAEAQLALAQSQLKRSRLLYQKGIAPLKQQQQDQAAVTQAQAALQDAQARRQEYQSAAGGAPGPSRFELRAPIAGRLAASSAAVGELVQPQQSVFTIVDDTEIWVEAPVPEDDIGTVGAASSATLLASGYPGRRFALQRVASTGVVDPATHTLTLIFGAANPHGELKPGMVGTIELRSRRRAPMITVPQAALIYEPESTVVFVAESGNVFRQQAVTVAYLANGQAVIAAGLKPGERVVTSGAGLLSSQLRRSTIQGMG